MPSWDRLNFRFIDVIKKFTGEFEKEVEMSDFVGNIEQLEHMEVVLIGERLRYVVLEFLELLVVVVMAMLLLLLVVVVKMMLVMVLMMMMRMMVGVVESSHLTNMV
jgi:hypothetical protein